MPLPVHNTCSSYLEKLADPWGVEHHLLIEAARTSDAARRMALVMAHFVAGVYVHACACVCMCICARVYMLVQCPCVLLGHVRWREGDALRVPGVLCTALQQAHPSAAVTFYASSAIHHPVLLQSLAPPPSGNLTPATAQHLHSGLPPPQSTTPLLLHHFRSAPLQTRPCALPVPQRLFLHHLS